MSGREIVLRPHVAWPRAMAMGQKYLVTVDLEHMNSGDWTYEEEDCPITCVLTGSWQLDVRVVDSPTVVLHRFGGTYGPARFVVEAMERLPASGTTLTLTLISAGGVPIRRDPLPIAAWFGKPDASAANAFKTVAVPLPEVIEHEVVEREVVEPAQGTCRVVLVGASRFSGFSDLPAVPGILEQLRELLTSQGVGGVNPEDITVLGTPTRTDAERAIREACERPVEKLFIYLAGHLTKDQGTDLYLALQDSAINRPRTAIAFESIRRMVERSAATHKFLVIDHADTDLPGPLPRLTSGQLIVSRLNPSATGTRSAYDSLFVQVLSDGIPHGPEQLSFSDIYFRMRKLCPEQSTSEIAFSSGSSSGGAFVKNRALSPPRARGLDARRAVQILASGSTATRFGSGYLMTANKIITSAHVVDGASWIDLEFTTTMRAEHISARAVWVNLELDVAVLHIERIPDAVGSPEGVLPVRFGRVRGLADAESLGYPRFKFRRSSQVRHGNDDLLLGQDHLAVGTVRPRADRPGNALDLRFRTLVPRGLGADSQLSPWDGMSGAAVWSGGCIVGVVNQYGRDMSDQAFTSSAIDRWYDILPTDQITLLHELIELPTDAEDLEVIEGRPDDPVGIARQLPSDVNSFTGREAEIEQLFAFQAAYASADLPGPCIVAIDGMPGVGKTAFAVHAANRLEAQYPDGALFVSMHGHSARQPAVKPADALAMLLARVGVSSTGIPSDVHEREAMWRNWSRRKRLVMILDDVAGGAQVLPLLPTSSESLVLMTSRRRLTDLDDARTLSLDVLPAHDAALLFARLSDRVSRTGRDSDSDVTRVAELCGRLPLALAIVAARLRHNPRRTIRAALEQLNGASDLLAEFDAEGLSLDSAIGLSYRELTVTQQQLFWLLGTLLGPDCDEVAAARLLKSDTSTARRLLDELVVHHLVDEVDRSRYRMHDLVRRYATKVGNALHADELEEAVGRQLDYYGNTARRMGRAIALYPTPRSASADSESANYPPTSTVEGLRWLRAERANVLACLEYAYKMELHTYAISTTSALATLLALDGSDGQAPFLHERAADIAARIGDHLAQANALTDLGVALEQVGENSGARDRLGAALEIYQALDNRLGQANALTELSSATAALGNYVAAQSLLSDALGLYRGLDERLGEAHALSELATVMEKTGDFRGAASCLNEAIATFENMPNPLGHADALTRRGAAQMASGEFQRAARTLESALKAQLAVRHAAGEAHALTNLGHLEYALGDYNAATHRLRRALDIYIRLDRPRGRANALLHLGVVSQARGERRQAVALLQEALEVSRELGPLTVANAMTCLGAALVSTGDLAEAQRLQHASLRLYREIGARDGEAVALNHLGAIYLEQDDVPAAHGVYELSSRIARELHAWDYEAHALEGLAHCSYRRGAPGDSFDDFNRALEIYRRLGMQTRVEHLTALLERVRARLPDAEIDTRPSGQPSERAAPERA